MIANNIFIYHLDAELQKLYIRYTRYNPNDVFKQFNCITRVAYLLSKEKILIPASNYFESNMAFSIINSFSPLNQFGCIELLSTSPRLDLLLRKKEKEHGDNITNKEYHYADFINNENGLYLPGTLITRHISPSQYIRKNWLASIGTDTIWRPLQETMPSNVKYSALERKLEEVPKLLDGRAYISDYIVPLLGIDIAHQDEANHLVNIFVTQNYIRSYLEEYDAVSLQDIPYINSNEILPSLEDRQHLSYSKYASLLKVKPYKGRNAYDYISTCRIEELLEFKYSNLWKNICNPTDGKERKYFKIGDYHMNAQNVRFGIVSALPKELVAMATMMYDTKQFFFEDKPVAGNRYLLGKIRSANDSYHLVALCQLPSMGNNVASNIATKMQIHFKNMHSVIMCGIAGGAPSPNKPGKDIHLGDVVVSDLGGVFQYDLIKETTVGTEHRAHPSRPSGYLLEAVQAIKQEEIRGSFIWHDYISQGINMLKGDDFSRPDCNTDIFHNIEGTIIDRDVRTSPHAYEGMIGSANILLKNPGKRDKLRDEFDLIAFEMEGSGIQDSAWIEGNGYLIVRGICDYCDQFKNDIWQNYSALAAAAYTRRIIEHLPSNFIE